MLIACSGGDTSIDSNDTAETGDTEETDTDDTGDTGTAVPLTGAMSGTVVGPDGQPLFEAAVNICRVVCFRVLTDANGGYSYSELEAWTASFYVIPDASSGLATAMAPLSWADGENKVLDIQMLERGPSQPIPAVATELELADGLWVTLGMDTLVPAFGYDLVDTSAVRVAEADRLPIELDDEVLDVWYVHPWESEAEAGAALRVANTYGLAPGESVRAWVASLPTEYSWLDAGTLTVSGDGTMLEGEAALPVLTTLVLTRE